jgi:hypothetical protein
MDTKRTCRYGERTCRARMLKLTKTNAVRGADLNDDRGGRIATVTVVSQLITDIGRLVGRAQSARGDVAFCSVIGET